MNRFALIAFWRSLTRHKLYAALNIGGLALGIAVFLVLTLYVRFETSYESWLPAADQVVIVEKDVSRDTDKSTRSRRSMPAALYAAIQSDLPGTIATRIRSASAAVIRNGVGVSERGILVDPDFFRVFPLKVVRGAVPARFSDPTAIVITRRTATKYFGGTSPIGAILPVTHDGAQHAYRVVAVVEDLPENSDFDYDLIAPIVISQDKADHDYPVNHYWNFGSVATYVRLPAGGDVAAFDRGLQAITARHVASETPDSDRYELRLHPKPLLGMHAAEPGAKLMVTTLGITGLLTLLLAIVNYINLATARASLRAREVGMRKVLGATRAALVRHYIGEAVITAIAAAVLGLALAELGLPLVNAATGFNLAVHYIGVDGVLLPLLGLAVVIGVLAGIYPALVLSRVPAAAVLAASRAPSGGRGGTRVREALVVFQFAVTIALIVGTLVLSAQTRHLREADVGFNRQQLLLVPAMQNDSLDQTQRAAALRAFAGLGGVTGVSMGGAVPGQPNYVQANNVPIPGRPGNGPDIEAYGTLPGFFDLIGAHVLAGRLFDAARPGDINPGKSGDMNSATLSNVVLNRSAVRALGFASPSQAVGRIVGGDHPKQIIGVIEDMRFRSPRELLPPTMYLFQIEPMTNGTAVVRFTGDPKAFTAAAEAAWRRVAPQVPFNGRTVVQSLGRFYKSDDQTASLFLIGSALAVAIGCVGLWGLASFTTARRIREIGIRKTLGASSLDIVRLLVGQFLKPVLIANVFAWPLAYFAMQGWLAGFDDRIALSPLFFLAASALATVIAVVTVLAQSIRASRATPAWALRHE